MMNATYSVKEKSALITLGVFGFLTVNIAFLYGMFVQPELLNQAMSNPVAMAFIGEAMVMMCFFAWLLNKWGVMKMHWSWFIVLSLVGSMAFALPIVLLWERKKSAS